MVPAQSETPKRGEPELTMGRLSTHVLDTAHGRPAANVAIELHRLADDDQWIFLKRSQTNSDGRNDAPLLTGEQLLPGTYRLSFFIGAYFSQQGSSAGAPSFLDIVPVRFTIAEPDRSYHIPLLVSPWGYTTYRGS